MTTMHRVTIETMDDGDEWETTSRTAEEFAGALMYAIRGHEVLLAGDPIHVLAQAVAEVDDAIGHSNLEAAFVAAALDYLKLFEPTDPK
jgi:hypothetical protein